MPIEWLRAELRRKGEHLDREEVARALFGTGEDPEDDADLDGAMDVEPRDYHETVPRGRR